MADAEEPLEIHHFDYCHDDQGGKDRFRQVIEKAGEKYDYDCCRERCNCASKLSSRTGSVADCRFAKTTGNGVTLKKPGRYTAGTKSKQFLVCVNVILMLPCIYPTEDAQIDVEKDKEDGICMDTSEDAGYRGITFYVDMVV